MEEPGKRKRELAEIAECAAFIGERFRNKRIELGESQGVFARRMGTTQDKVSEIEKGLCNPKLVTLEAWARRLCIDVATLVRNPKSRDPQMRALPEEAR